MKNIFVGIFVAVVSTFVACDDDLKYDMDTVYDYESNFEFLWKEFDQKYSFFDYKKDSIKDWNAVHDEYLTYVRNCKNEVEFFDVLAAMLNELKDGHVNLLSSFDISNYDFEDNYPSDVDGGVLSNDRYLGKNCRRSGGLKYKTLRDGKVGYIRYADFTVDFSNSQLDFILNSFENTDGLIIDVRSNYGGMVDYVYNIISHFVDESYTAYYTVYKNGVGHSDFSSPLSHEISPVDNGVVYRKPVYVLVDRGCYSATNCFAFSIKGLPRVTLLGGKTGGGAGAPMVTELPNGWTARFSGTILLDKNKQITEFGVDPDIELHLDKELAYTQGLDNIIETACDYIEGVVK